MEQTKTSANTWKALLELLLNQGMVESGQVPRTGNRPFRIAVIGVGNPLRSDDGAGVLVARRLANRAADHLLVIEAGQAPENRTAELRRFAPGLVLIVDAAEMDAAPGAIGWIPEERIDGLSASTHSLPLSMLARYLKLEVNCIVMFLGIQPASNEVGERASEDVLQAVDEVVKGLNELICR